jgi:[ribosomal protein S18]-alanine N-acetyltransferase
MSSGGGDFVFRAMDAGDLERVIAIAEALPQALHWPRTAYTSAIDPQAEPGRVAFVAADSTSKAVAGFIIATLLPPQSELEIVAVSPEAQRRGIARCLMAVLAGRLRTGNVTEVTLEVRASNDPALALYRSMGFAEVGGRRGYYIDPVEDAVLMKLELR